MGRAILLQDTLEILAKVQAQKLRLSNADTQKIKDFTAFVARQFQLAPHWEEYLCKKTIRRIKYAHALQPLVAEYLLPRLRDRLIFVHMACYLEVHSVLVKLFHEMGYTVAEPQHGIIHKWHWAYQYPTNVLNDNEKDSRVYFPDILLTFGDYWSTQVRIPSQSIVVGFPHLSEAVQNLTNITSQNPDQILIVSQGIVTERMVDTATKLSKSLPRYRIIFKLHPGEVGLVERYRKLYDLPNITVVGGANIHKLIAESSIIVGATSTVLFEAVAFPHKRIFILENKVITAPIGAVFATDEELIEMIQSSNIGYPANSPEHFWASNWDERLTTFLGQHLPAEKNLP
jgi:hypothetical protein